MLVLSFLATWAALLVFWRASEPGVIVPVTATVAALIALVATGVEAISPWGLDNLLVPAGSAIGLIVGVLVMALTVPGVA